MVGVLAPLGTGHAQLHPATAAPLVVGQERFDGTLDEILLPAHGLRVREESGEGAGRCRKTFSDVRIEGLNA